MVFFLYFSEFNEWEIMNPRRERIHNPLMVLLPPTLVQPPPGGVAAMAASVTTQTHMSPCWTGIKGSENPRRCSSRHEQVRRGREVRPPPVVVRFIFSLFILFFYINHRFPICELPHDNTNVYEHSPPTTAD